MRWKILWGKWNEPPPTTPKASLHPEKMILFIWWDWKGVLYMSSFRKTKGLIPTSITPQFSSIQFSRSVVSNSLQLHESQNTRPLCPSPTPRVHSDSRPLSPWCHPAISSSVIPFFSCPQSLPASESFPMSQLGMRWPKYWSFSFSIIPSKEIPGLI